MKKEKKDRQKNIDEDSPTAPQSPDLSIKEKVISEPSKTASSSIPSVPPNSVITQASILTTPIENNDVNGTSLYFNMVFPLFAMCILGFFVYRILSKHPTVKNNNNEQPNGNAVKLVYPSDIESKVSGSSNAEVDWDEWDDEKNDKPKVEEKKESKSPNSLRMTSSSPSSLLIKQVPSLPPVKDKVVVPPLPISKLSSKQKTTPPKSMSDDLFAVRYKYHIHYNHTTSLSIY